MALTNIFKEPKKEISETLIGIVIAAAMGIPDYIFAKYLDENTITTYTHFNRSVTTYHMFPIPLGMLIGLSGLALIPLIAGFIHFIGEEASNRLKKRGVRLP